MFSNKTKIGMKRLYFLILLSIFTFPSFAFAYTYQDVVNAYNSVKTQYPKDLIWVEEVTTNSGSGYRVYRRQNASTIVDKTSSVVTGAPYEDFNCIYNVYTCDGQGGSIPPPTGPAKYYNLRNGTITGYNNYCDGSKSVTSSNGPGWSYWCIYGVSSTCPLGSSDVSNCSSYDVLLGQYIPVDKCLNKLTNTYEPCLQNCKDPVEKTNVAETCGDGIDNNCNGEIDEGCKKEIELPMTVYQCADGVGAKTYDTTNQDICTSGCALASATMALNYYLNQSGLPMIDVLSLNEWLNKNNGYADKPETPQFDGLMDWFVISLYPNSPIRYDWVKSNDRLDIDTKTALLNSQLMDGYPIILRVKTTKGTTHFVVATGINGTTWDIIDPGHQDAKTTLAERYKNTFYGIRVYKPRQ